MGRILPRLLKRIDYFFKYRFGIAKYCDMKINGV